MPNNASPELVPLIMTRPRATSEAVVAALPDPVRAQLAPVFSPLIDITQVAHQLELGPHDSAVFSSRNGVQAGPNGHDRTAYCIGPATTKAAIAKGWTAKQVGSDADGLVQALQAIAPTGRLVHLSGTHTRGDIAGRLSQAGLNITNVAIYDQLLRPLSQEAAEIILTAPRVIIPLFSPRTAAHFIRTAPAAESVHAIALSRAVADEFPAHSVCTVTVAGRPDAQAMGAALAEVLARN